MQRNLQFFGILILSLALSFCRGSSSKAKKSSSSAATEGLEALGSDVNITGGEAGSGPATIPGQGNATHTNEKQEGEEAKREGEEAKREGKEAKREGKEARREAKREGKEARREAKREGKEAKRAGKEAKKKRLTPICGTVLSICPTSTVSVGENNVCIVKETASENLNCTENESDICISTSENNSLCGSLFPIKAKKKG